MAYAKISSDKTTDKFQSGFSIKCLASNCAYNVLVNRYGLPVQSAITAGNIQDCIEAIPLLVLLPVKPDTSILGGRICGSKGMRD